MSQKHQVNKYQANFEQQCSPQKTCALAGFEHGSSVPETDALPLCHTARAE
jgi:hypothetical protein